jgi:hypothetical protein
MSKRIVVGIAATLAVLFPSGAGAQAPSDCATP